MRTRSFFLLHIDSRPLCTLRLLVKVTSSSSVFLLSFLSSSSLLLFHFVQALFLHLSQTKPLTNQCRIRHCMYPTQCLSSRPTPETSQFQSSINLPCHESTLTDRSITDRHSPTHYLSSHFTLPLSLYLSSSSLNPTLDPLSLNFLSHIIIPINVFLL